MTFDRGAEEFKFPPGLGMLVGPGNPMARGFMMQRHYLVTETYDEIVRMRGEPVWDT